MNKLLSLFKSDTWVRPYLTQYKKALRYSLGLGILTMFFACALMFTSGYLISISAEWPDLGVYALFGVLGFVQIFGIGKPFLGYFERLASHDWVLHTTSKLRLRLYSALESNGVFWNTTKQAGEALGFLSEDIAHIQNLYLRTVFPSIIAIVLWIAVSLLFGFFSPVFGLGIAIIIGTLVFLLPVVSALTNRARILRQKEITTQLYTQTYDNTLGITDWILSRRKEAFINAVETLDKETTILDKQQQAFSRKRDFLVHTLFILCAAAILIWSAVYFGYANQPGAQISAIGRPADWIAAFVLGFFPLLEAFIPLSDGLSEAYTHFDSIKRLNNLENPDNCPNQNSAYFSDTKTSATSQTLTLDTVSFSYPKSTKTLLDSISLTVTPGEKVAILGPSGTGKTTLASLIRGDLIPTKGQILLGDTPISQLQHEISRHIVVINQKPYLFNQTLFENLSLGNPEITEAQALEALYQVELGSLVETLPLGIHTMVDEAGLSLSGGEAHRVALARVLLTHAPLIILDEPTLGLDPLTERNLLMTMFATLEGRTVITITHHLIGCESMDRVLFLDKGKVALDGSPEQLYKTNTHYRALFEMDNGWITSSEE